MHVDIEVDKVHTDDARDVIFVTAGQRRILLLLCSFDHAGRDLSVVVVSEWVAPNRFGHEPTWPTRLLLLHDKELQAHENDNAEASENVRLIVQKILVIHHQVERHEELHC